MDMTIESSRFNGKYDKEFFKFKRSFAGTENKLSNPSNEDDSRFDPIHVYHNDCHQTTSTTTLENRPQQSRLRNLIRSLFGGQASDEVDIEAFNEICRPPQNIPTMPTRSRMYDPGALEDAVPFHVERNVFSINGKAINSMDIQTQNIDDCPESYNVRNGLF